MAADRICFTRQGGHQVWTPSPGLQDFYLPLAADGQERGRTGVDLPLWMNHTKNH